MQSPRVAARKLRRRAIVFGVFIGLSVAMMAVSNTSVAGDFRGATQYAFRPITSTLDGIADTAGSFWSVIAEIDRLHSENDRLKEENAALQNEINRIPEIKLINNDWTKITETQKAITYKTMAAAVLVRDVNGPQRTMILDKGTGDGLKKGEIVVAAGGALVGRITDIGPGTSTVRLINDIGSVVTGKTVDPTGGQDTATGDVKGQVGGLLEMINVNASERLVKGQAVVTAGYRNGEFSSVYPPALLIGQVVDVSRDANAVVQTAFLEPSVDFDHVRYVLVITNYEGGLGVEPTPGPSPTDVPAP